MGSNTHSRSSVSRVNFAQMEAALTIGKSRSALACASALMPGKRSHNLLVYCSASPTVSTYTSVKFTPASSAAWMSMKAESKLMAFRLYRSLQTEGASQ